MAAKPRPKAKSRSRVESIDEYLASLEVPQRAALQKLRRAIHAAAPRAKECISYQLPAFRLDGKVLVVFGAAKQHCSFFPGSGRTVAALEDDLKSYDTSKGTIRFLPSKPLPAALIWKVVKARIAENSASQAVPATKSRRPSVTRKNEINVDEVVAALRRMGTKKTRDGMARYAIPSDNAFGVPVGVMRNYGKRLGRDHELAAALWETGWYEARMMAAFVDDPASVTVGQMEKWSREFDSWAICDTVCFHLFSRTPHAWEKVATWSKRRDEFVKRAAFALLASLVLRDKDADVERFAQGLAVIERAADDERNFVKKSVNWALRTIGKRNAALHAVAVEVARRLAESTVPASRWVGKGALRELTSPAVIRRLASRRSNAVAATGG